MEVDEDTVHFISWAHNKARGLIKNHALKNNEQ